jgi:PAS domain-containing protein
LSGELAGGVGACGFCYVRIVVRSFVLRLILPIRSLADIPDAATGEESLSHWVKVASASLDPCLVLDEKFRVAGVSWSAAQLIGEPAAGIVGRNLVEDVLRVVDFTDAAGSGEIYARGIPPVAALRDNHLSRGLLRLRRPGGDRITLDAVAAPIHGHSDRVVGSITFFASL